jgi:hypothetical protein
LPDRLKIKTVIEVWKQLVNDEKKIISIDTERLFGSFESSFYKKSGKHTCRKSVLEGFEEQD